jgi:DNA polymerase III delta prime subunit
LFSSIGPYEHKRGTYLSSESLHYTCKFLNEVGHFPIEKRCRSFRVRRVSENDVVPILQILENEEEISFMIGFGNVGL